MTLPRIQLNRRIIIIALLIIGLILYYFAYGSKRASENLTDIPGEIVLPMMSETPQPLATTPSLASDPATSPSTPPSASPPITNPTAVLSGISGRNVSGDVTFITTTEGTFIRLEDNFSSSSSAPDNRVYLGNSDGFQVEISKLKAPSGSQNFKIPSDINLANYTHVWIHCKAFNTTYGVGQIVR